MGKGRYEFAGHEAKARPGRRMPGDEPDVLSGPPEGEVCQMRASEKRLKSHQPAVTLQRL